VALELGLWRLVPDLRCLNRVVVLYLHGIQCLWVESGKVLVHLKVRTLQRRHLPQPWF